MFEEEYMGPDTLVANENKIDCRGYMDEEDTIALEYDAVPEIIPSVPEKLEEKTMNTKIEPVLENFLYTLIKKNEQKFEKMIENLSSQIEIIETKVDTQIEDLESLKSVISEKLNSITDEIEKEIKSIKEKYKQVFNKVEAKLIQIDNKDDKKSILLKEIAEQFDNTRESFKDLEIRIDKLEINEKSLKVLGESKIKEKDLEISFKHAQLEEIQEKVLDIQKKLEKNQELEHDTKKNINKIETFTQDFSNWQASLEKAIEAIEEKVSETKRLKIQFSSMQKEVFSKISTLDYKILEISEDTVIENLKKSITSTENRVCIIEEKLSKGLNEVLYTQKHRDQLIESRLAYLEQERLNIEELKSKIANKSDTESFRDSNSFKKEMSLDDRIASLEKITKKKNFKAKNPEIFENKYTELTEVLPEEAESFVISSMIGKINKQTMKEKVLEKNSIKKYNY